MMMFVSFATPVAPFAGETETIVGAVVSTTAPGLTVIVAVTDVAPLELAVSVTAVVLETLAGGEYVVLVPVAADSVPTSGLIAHAMAAVPSVSVAEKPAEPVPAVSVALPGVIASFGVFAGVSVGGQATKLTALAKHKSMIFQFFMWMFLRLEP
jgi:hypothetical protein